MLNSIPCVTKWVPIQFRKLKSISVTIILTVRNSEKFKVGNGTIAHTKITELIPKQFRFGNSSTKITE